VNHFVFLLLVSDGLELERLFAFFELQQLALDNAELTCF
jgi:hypothetical protein